jgi:hypothetical protein
VIDAVVIGCKQEHTKATSEEGRAKMLEKMLAAAVACPCLLRKATDSEVGVLNSVVVL